MIRTIAALGVILCLAGCVVAGPQVADGPAPAPYPNPYPYPNPTGGGEVIYTEEAPVYIAAYPDAAFYQRYYGGCDCIMIVRYSNGIWYDHRGHYVHRGDWVRARPTPRALAGHRTFMQQNRTTFHPTPPPGHRGAQPGRPAVAAPAPQAAPPVQVSPPVVPVVSVPRSTQPAPQAQPMPQLQPVPQVQSAPQPQPPQQRQRQVQAQTQAQPPVQQQPRTPGQARGQAQSKQAQGQAPSQAQPRQPRPRLIKCADGAMKVSC